MNINIVYHALPVVLRNSPIDYKGPQRTQDFTHTAPV